MQQVVSTMPVCGFYEHTHEFYMNDAGAKDIPRADNCDLCNYQSCVVETTDARTAPEQFLDPRRLQREDEWQNCDAEYEGATRVLPTTPSWLAIPVTAARFLDNMKDCLPADACSASRQKDGILRFFPVKQVVLLQGSAQRFLTDSIKDTVPTLYRPFPKNTYQLFVKKHHTSVKIIVNALDSTKVQAWHGLKTVCLSFFYISLIRFFHAATGL